MTSLRGTYFDSVIDYALEYLLKDAAKDSISVASKPVQVSLVSTFLDLSNFKCKFPDENLHSQSLALFESLFIKDFIITYRFSRFTLVWLLLSQKFSEAAGVNYLTSSANLVFTISANRFGTLSGPFLNISDTTFYRFSCCLLSIYVGS